MSDDSLPRIYKCEKTFIPSVGETHCKELTVVAETSDKAKSIFDKLWKDK